MSYTSIKLGAYAPVRDALGAGKDSPFYMKFLAGAITGGVGSVVGNVSGIIPATKEMFGNVLTS